MPNFTQQLEDYTGDFFDDYIESQKPQEGEPQAVPAKPVDTWQMYANARSEYARKRFPNGATKKFGLAAKSVLAGLEKAYERVKMDVENSEKHGDKMRARLWRQQYMEDAFMPAIESLVLLGSADELLGMSDILKQFDELALVEGVSGAGYTEALIRSLYDDKLGQKNSKSDAIVRGTIREINELAYKGNIREAVGRARKLLEKINNGENSADDDDYELLQNMLARAQ